MVPYVSYLLQPLSSALYSFKSNDYNVALWSSVINVLTRTFNHDENGKLSIKFLIAGLLFTLYSRFLA